jgi:hypothetical protein
MALPFFIAKYSALESPAPAALKKALGGLRLTGIARSATICAYFPCKKYAKEKT